MHILKTDAMEVSHTPEENKSQVIPCPECESLVINGRHKPNYYQIFTSEDVVSIHTEEDWVRKWLENACMRGWFRRNIAYRAYGNNT